MIKNNARVLFQGDSVTDCGRSIEDESYLGNGYANFIAAWYSAVYPEKGLTFINRGISGNRAIDLVGRWDDDCIALKPDLVSILIGINDCWRRYDSNDPTSTEKFEDYYRKILVHTREKLAAKIVLCEPFVLPHPQDRKKWREDLDPKIHVVRELAREFDAVYVPFDGIFARACTRREPAYWAEDGVHPTQEGHALMAKTWLESVGLV
ncbi:MAG TPA: SGNH/GDSL hydrolase family protein [Clostridia bacterium]|nr:SGNH/GDSL hydrolase family protein [Clostridia bacterium]